MARVISTVQEALVEGMLMGMLLLVIKEAFYHITMNYLLRTMESMDIDDNLMRWTQSFMSNRSVRLVIDAHQCLEVEVETGVRQGSPVSPILFGVYFTGVFGELTKRWRNVQQHRSQTIADSW